MKRDSSFWLKIFGLFCILVLPSILYLLLNTGKHNFNQLPYFGPTDPPRSEATEGEKKDTIYHTIPDFKFVDQSGDTITQKNFEGKVYVTDYFFTTCPGICPKMSSLMYEVQKKFENNPEVLFLSHTVNPEIDSVATLAAYAEKVHAIKGKWFFVTGDKKELYEMARKAYFLDAEEGDGGPDDFIHSEKFILIDKERHIRGIYDGTSKKEVDRLTDEIKVLLASYHIPRKGTKSNDPSF